MSDTPNRVTVGSWVADQDTVGDYRLTTNIDGWGAAPRRVSIEEKSQQDGGWDATGHQGPRSISLEGFVDCSTPALAHAAEDALVSLSSGELLTFSVDNEDVGVRWCRARVVVGANPEWGDDRSFSYAVSLLAPDPLKYGPESYISTTLAAASGGTGLVFPMAFPLDFGVAPGVTAGVVTLANEGTAAYWPRLRIDGPVTNPVVTLHETGAWVRYGGTVQAGQWLDIDTANRRVLLNGQVSHRHKVTSSGNWLAVPEGGGSLSWSADFESADARLGVWSYSGAWY